MILNRRTALAGLALPLLTGPARALTRSHSADPLLFAYFGTGADEATGLKLALSDDGFTFRELAGGASFLRPQVGESRLMRDPFVFRGQGRDPLWHMVWTTAWGGTTIGYSSSRDLRNWAPQRAIPVMASVPNTKNCWAPEAIWDTAARRYVIFWSSTVEGRFTETRDPREPGSNHRLWYVTTKDFVTFSKPDVLFDPGFSVIDGTFAEGPGGDLHLIVKDETPNPPAKYLQVVTAQSATGPFGKAQKPFTPAWVEGPMTTRIGDETICYWDVYTAGRWGAAATRDFVTWRDVSDRLRMPKGARHGSLVRIPRGVAQGLAAGPVTQA